MRNEKTFASENEKIEIPDWVQQFQRKLRIHIWRMVGSRDDAEELAQETFLKALEAWPTFRGESSVETWLYRIGTNLAINHIKKHSRESLLDQNYDVADFQNAETITVLAEEINSLQKALHQLPPQQRAVVLLRVKEEKKYSEIAEIMDLSLGTVKAHYSFAIKRLKQHILTGVIKKNE